MSCTQGDFNRRFIGAGLLFLFLTVLGVTVFPELHKSIHHDADEAEHSCAVTLILSGGTEAPLAAPQVEFAIHPVFSLASVPSFSLLSFFLSGFVPDHSPPSLS